MSEYAMKEVVQERLAISHDTLDKLIAKGEITAVKIGRAVRIDLASVESYIRRNTIRKTEESSFGGFGQMIEL